MSEFWENPFFRIPTWLKARPVMVPVAVLTFLSYGAGLIADVGQFSPHLRWVELAASVRPFLLGMLCGGLGVCLAVDRRLPPGP